MGLLKQAPFIPRRKHLGYVNVIQIGALPVTLWFGKIENFYDSKSNPAQPLQMIDRRPKLPVLFNDDPPQI